MFNLHRPIVSANATRYLLVTVLSFAATVVATRVYLELTGYPQIGNDTFHIAHALWGGLFLVIAVLLMLVFANRWTYDVSAIIAGVGVGLFIDEVGKFITQQNDYFFPLAAPIIYVAFLVMLLIYLMVRGRTSSADLIANMYQIIRELEEVLEDDLSVSERDAMLAQIKPITEQTDRPDVAELAKHIHAFLHTEAVTVVPDRPSPFSSLMERFQKFENHLFSQGRTRMLLTLVFLLNGLSTLFVLFTLISALATGSFSFPTILGDMVVDEVHVTSTTSLNWFIAMIALQIITGLLLFVSAVTFLRKRDTTAIRIGEWALVISIVFINPLSFYFNQFSILLNSAYLFLILLALRRYRFRFLSAA